MLKDNQYQDKAKGDDDINDESEDDNDDVYRIARTLEVARMRMKTMPVIMMTMTMLARS